MQFALTNVGQPNAFYAMLLSFAAKLTSHLQVLAIAPLMMLGLLAATCIISSAEWDGEAIPESLSIGASEEGEAAKVPHSASLTTFFSSP
jgi:hypothetical protein